MSRLYDALKEAGHFRQGVEGRAGENVWDELGLKGREIGSALHDPDVSDTGASAPGPADEADALIPQKSFLDAESAPPYGELGITIAASLNRKARLMPHAVDPSIAEHYRRLRTKILQQQAERPFRSLVVTSANPQEGKTVTVLNLGMSFAMLPSFKVLVVDGDLRQGKLEQWLGVDNSHPGLSNLIDGSAELEDVVLKSDAIPMHFIVRGNSQMHDMHSSQLAGHIQRMTEQYDLVLVDTAPVTLMADVQLLAASCDAILLVARAFSTSRKAMARALDELQPFRVIGTVLNATSEVQRYRYYSGS
ncbi:MAG TPA: CpsD/CapB family tyrosine-protein kinase [Bryobacteraceae bacterium]|nr:CpsD/CapB family tyrosine-protein kinase [Bryobacteraceae bacterium]